MVQIIISLRQAGQEIKKNIWHETPIDIPSPYTYVQGFICLLDAVFPLEADFTTLYFYKVGCKSRGQKSQKILGGNLWVGFNSPTGRETYRLVWI